MPSKRIQTRHIAIFCFTAYKDKIDSLEFAVMRLEKTDNEAFTILDRRLELAGDVKYIYRKSDTLEKREFLDLVFDSNLYYEKGIYRTPTMMEALSHNVLKMKELGVLIVEKKRENFSIPPPSALVGIRTPNLLIRSEMLYPIELQMHFRFRCFVNGLQK